MYGIISTQMLWSFREARKLQCQGSHHYKYDRDGKGSQMKSFDMMGIQTPKCSLAGLALGNKLH